MRRGPHIGEMPWEERIVIDEVVTDPDALDELLERGGRWHSGRVVAAVAERIGAEYGLSGEIHRVTVRLDDGDTTTIVAKTEHRDRTRTAVMAWEQAGRLLGRSVPILYGWSLGEERGLILTEDVVSSRQGDDLVGCTPDEAGEIVDLLARLHTATDLATGTSTPEAPEFSIRVGDADRWSLVLERSAARYPDIVDDRRLGRLRSLPAEIREEMSLVGAGEARCWVHVDPHLDNILWRLDTSPVLLDWSNARVGPPEVDVAALLVGYAFRSSPPLSPADLLRRYEMSAGRAVSLDLLRVIVRAVFVQGVVGWAGEASNEGFPDRKRLLRDDTIGRAIRALDWTDQIAGG